MYSYFEKCLEEANVSIYRVCKDTGINLTSLYEWKAGKYTPKVDKLVKIASYFGKPLENFIN